MEIGLISDTHGYLDPQVLRSFETVDEIWHAGDFGTIEVANALAELKPLRGVFGNIDDVTIQDQYPEDLRFEIEGVDVLITHIAGRPGRYDPRVRKLLQANSPRLLICGHSHILHVEDDPRFDGMKTINPGAAGHQGFHQIRTVMKFELVGGEINRLRVIELGRRGRDSAIG